MTRPRTWLRDHWQQLVIAATALMVAAIFAGTVIAFLTGRDTNRTVTLQQATVDRAVCVSEINSTFFRAIGDVVVDGAETGRAETRHLQALRAAQADLAVINQLCPPPTTEETP